MIKKLCFLFLTLVGIIHVGVAAPVSENAARQKAVAFMTAKNHQRKAMRGVTKDRPELNTSSLQMTERNNAYYVFNIPSDEGYVIVSGDDRLPEVLGYSHSGQYDGKVIPENMRAWMEGYVRQYEYLQSHPETMVTAQNNNRESIEPLVKCKFDQGTPYNNQCPTINGQKTPTGCVATAMAQIMYYYQWPKQTTDIIPAYTTSTRKISMPAIPVTTIDWDNILGEYNYNSYSDEQAKAVSTLMLLCGAASTTNYNIGASGAGTGQTVFQKYFGYGDQGERIVRSDYAPELWEQILYDELASGRPILYDGFSGAVGHAFVMDGYEDGYFHVNFGWDGYSDDYFMIPNIREWVDDQAAVIGLQPDNENYSTQYSVLDDGKLTLYYDKEKKNRQGTILVKSEWADHADEITECVIDPSFANHKPVSLMLFFQGMKKMESIKGIEYLNTTNVGGGVEAMFYDCSSLKSLDLSRFNTSNVTSMRFMFCGCSSLTSLDVSGFNTSNVTDMIGMFERCSSLTSLDVSGFNTSKVTEIVRIFSGCSSLTNLDVSGFNTSNVTNMRDMFRNCSSLTSLDVSGFNTSNVTNMSEMFQDCSSLTSLDVSGFNTSNVTNMSYMFSYCSSLTSLDVSGFNTSNVTDMSYMFCDCSSLTSLDVSSFNTSNVTDMGGMFNYCSALTSLDVSGFNTFNVTNMSWMFSTCLALTSLDVSNFNTSKVMEMGGMFGNCHTLTSLDVSNFNTSNVTNMSGMFFNCKALTTIYADEKVWNTSNVTNGGNMFNYCSKLVGGNGTAYSYGNWGLEYARIDKEGTPGYLTHKTGTGIQLPKMMGMDGDVWYTLDGRRLSDKPIKKGVYLFNGRKTVVK